MQFIIAFLVIVFLSPSFVNAQSGDPLGPNCKSKSKQLGFKNRVFVAGVPQDKGEWCWAATAQSLLGFHKKNIGPNQCDLVGTVLNKPCCGDNPPDDCHTIGQPEDVFDTNNYKLLYETQDRLGKLTWTMATEEICQGRPFISAVDLGGGPFVPDHSVVVFGYDANKKHPQPIPCVRVYDPADGADYCISYEYFFGEDGHVRDTFQIEPTR